MEFLNALSEDERRDYERINNFKSLYTLVYEVYEMFDMETLEDQKALEGYISRNSDYLALISNEFNELEYYPYYSNNEYSMLANSERILIVDNHCLKVCDDGLIATSLDNIDFLYSIHDIHAKNVPENDRISIVLFEDDENSPKSSCAPKNNVDHVPKPTQGRYRTKLKLVASGYQIIYNNGILLPNVNIVRNFGRVRPYRRTLGIWYHAVRTITGHIKYSLNYKFNNSLLGLYTHSVDESLSPKKRFKSEVNRSFPVGGYSYGVKFKNISSWGTTPSTGTVSINCN